MPEARMPCETCPWIARGKKRAGPSEDERREVANGAWRACEEDGGTCYGAVRFTASDAAAAYLVAPAAARAQAPEQPNHTPTTTAAPAQGVDFITTESEDV